MLTHCVEMCRMICRISVPRMSSVVVKLLELIIKYVQLLKKTVQVA